MPPQISDEPKFEVALVTKHFKWYFHIKYNVSFELHGHSITHIWVFVHQATWNQMVWTWMPNTGVVFTLRT